MPDLIQSEENINQVNPNAPLEPMAPTEPSSSAVTGMANLMEEGHPLMSSARNRTQEYMSGRGMAPSSIAAGAVERSAMEAAQPLVLADAATASQKERDVRLHGQDVALTDVQGDISSRLQAEKGDISSTLQGEAAEQNLIMEEYVQGMTNKRFADELAMKTQQMTADSRKAFSNATGPMFQQALAEKTRINQIADAEMNTEAKAVELARIDDALTRDVNFIASIYNYPLTWAKETTSLTPTVKPAATDTTTGPSGVNVNLFGTDINIPQFESLAPPTPTPARKETGGNLTWTQFQQKYPGNGYPAYQRYLRKKGA